MATTTSKTSGRQASTKTTKSAPTSVTAIVEPDRAPYIKIIQEHYGRENKTFDKPPSEAEIRRWAMLDYMLYPIMGFRMDGNHRNVHVIGDAGIGKTSLVEGIFAAFGIEVIRISCPAADDTVFGTSIVKPIPFTFDNGVTIPDRVEFELRNQFRTPTEKVVLFDELRQAPKQLRNLAMELASEGTVMGKKIPGLMGLIFLDNPVGEDYRLPGTEDFAFADRMGAIKITAADVPWQYAIACMFPHLDLKPLFDFIARLPLNEQSRRFFMPRVLEHVLRALDEGFNAIIGWPVYPDDRMPLTDLADNDIREETLNKIAELIKLPNPPLRPDDFLRAIKKCADKGYDVIAYSDPGMGKSSFTKAVAEQIGIRYIYASAPHLLPDQMAWTMRDETGDQVVVAPAGEFLSNEPTIVIIDEATRATRATQNVLNELINTHSLGGISIPGLRGSIMLSNLAKTQSGFKMDTLPMTLPAATRPTFSFILSAEDIGALGWLAEHYVEDPNIVKFIEWYRLDLNDEMRQLVTFRGLERIYDHHKFGQPLLNALVYINDERIAVNIPALIARLGERPQVSFLNLVEETEDYIKRLSALDDRVTETLEAQQGEFLRIDVAKALDVAELATLEAHRPVCLAVLKVLGRKWRFDVLQTSPEKWKFWHGVLIEAFPNAKLTSTKTAAE